MGACMHNEFGVLSEVYFLSVFLVYEHFSGAAVEEGSSFSPFIQGVQENT